MQATAPLIVKPSTFKLDLINNPPSGSDCDFLCDDGILCFPKSILVMVSRYFKRLCYGEFAESGKPSISFPGKRVEDVCAIFSIVYNVIWIEDAINENIKNDNAFSLLEICREWELDFIIMNYEQVLIKRFLEENKVFLANISTIFGMETLQKLLFERYENDREMLRKEIIDAENFSMLLPSSFNRLFIYAEQVDTFLETINKWFLADPNNALFVNEIEFAQPDNFRGYSFLELSALITIFKQFVPNEILAKYACAALSTVAKTFNREKKHTKIFEYKE